MGSFLKKNVMEICIAPAPLEVQRFDQIVEKAWLHMVRRQTRSAHQLTPPIYYFLFVGCQLYSFRN